jgi:predicted dehydrogenase
MAIDALHQGIHVLCEKPLSKTMDRVEELESAIARSHRVFAVAFCFRFHEGLTRAKTLLDAGAIGRLISIRCIMTENIDDVMGPQQSRYYRETGGVFDLVHEIDIACWLAGQEVTEVQALHGALSDLGFTAPDVAEIHLRFGPRCIGQIHLNFFSGPRTRVTELRGTHGTLAVEFARWDQCSVAVYRSATRTWVREDMPTERDFMFRREDEEFLRAIAEGTPVSCPLPEALRSQRVLACIQGEPRRDPKSRA